MQSKLLLLFLVCARFVSADGADGEPKEDKAKKELLFKEGDPFLVTNVNSHTGCMFVEEDDIPPNLTGDRTFNEKCSKFLRFVNPMIHRKIRETIKQHIFYYPVGDTDRCKLYVRTKIWDSPKKNDTCLKPTHLICDAIFRKCVCSIEGRNSPEIRFQFGTYDGKNSREEGRCFIRPTFEFVHGMECSAKSRLKEIATEEEAELSPFCICPGDKHDRFNSDDHNWWKCSGTIFNPNPKLILILVLLFFLSV